MRVVEVSNKVLLIRHWFKWYRVQRGAADWQRLEIKPRQKTIDDIQKALAKRNAAK